MTCRVFVTGASGFLGGHLCDALIARGHEVFGFSRLAPRGTGVKWLTGSITDARAVHEAMTIAKPEWVFHLAADMRRDRDWNLLPDMWNTNVGGTLNVAMAAIGSGVSAMVFTGSFEEYGAVPSPFDEDTIPRPTSPYGVTKAMATTLALGIANTIPATVLRLSIPYGPGQSNTSFIGGACHALRSKTPFPMSGGEQTRDFLYVDDAIAALLLAAERIRDCTARVFNVCSGVPTRLRDAVVMLGEKAGVPEFAEIGALPYRENEQMHYVGDNSAIRDAIGWMPQVSLAQGIELTLAHDGFPS